MVPSLSIRVLVSCWYAAMGRTLYIIRFKFWVVWRSCEQRIHFLEKELYYRLCFEIQCKTGSHITPYLTEYTCSYSIRTSLLSRKSLFILCVIYKGVQETYIFPLDISLSPTFCKQLHLLSVWPIYLFHISSSEHNNNKTVIFREAVH